MVKIELRERFLFVKSIQSLTQENTQQYPNIFLII